MPPKQNKSAPTTSQAEPNCTLTVTVINRRVVVPIIKEPVVTESVPITPAKGGKGKDAKAGAKDSAPLIPEIVPEGVRVRLFSKWTDCSVTSPIFGEEATLPWDFTEFEAINDEAAASLAPDAANQIKAGKATMVVNFAASVTDKSNNIDQNQLKKFHEDPGIYALVSYVTSTKLAPVNFLYLECSSLLVQNQEIILKRLVYPDIEVHMTLQIKNPMLAMKDLLTYEPLLINVKSLNNYPIYNNENIQTALDGVYIYGKLPIAYDSNNNITLERTVILFPHNAIETTNNNTPEKHRVGGSICILPGIDDLGRFHSLLATNNYALQVYQDDFLSRCFTTTFIEEYCKLVGEEPGGLNLPIDPNNTVAGGKDKKGGGAKDAKKDAKGGKKDANAGGVDDTVSKSTVTISGSSLTTATKSDLLIITNVHQELRKGPKIRSRGESRFRLEQLLDQAQDIIKKFQKKQETVDDHVVVKEDIIAEVRLAKPSEPEKWDLPADLSLKNALKGALNAPIKSLAERAGVYSRRPKHELFITHSTTLSIHVELHRTLNPNSKQFDSSIPENSLRATFNRPSLSSTMTQFLQTIELNESNEGKNKNKRRKSKENDKTSNTNSTAALSTIGDDENINNELSLQQLMKELDEKPFTRMILYFPYLDDEMMRRLNSGLNFINQRALPDIQGTIRSYSLTDKEQDAVIKGNLDLISGIMVIDDDMRLVILEGLAAPNKGMELLFSEYLYKTEDNDDERFKILCNPEILFPTRVYPNFCPDLRRIRVRGKLKQLAKQPEIYNRKQVEEICLRAVDGLMAISRAQDIHSTKTLDLYPPQVSLEKLELLYGETITKGDIDGTLRGEFLKTFQDRKQKLDQAEAIAEKMFNSTDQRDNLAISNSTRMLESIQSRGRSRKHNNEDGHGQDHKGSTTTLSRQRKVFEFTDCKNESFNEILRTRPQHRINHVQENNEIRKQAYRDMLYRRQQRYQALTKTLSKILTRSSSPTSKINPNTSTNANAIGNTNANLEELPSNIYMYSSQRENIKEKMWDDLRDRVKHDNKNNYTFSKDYISQSIAVVGEQDMKNINLPRGASNDPHQLTKRGFQYPAPRTRKEIISHPQRPSEARIEDLKEPYEEAGQLLKKISDESQHSLSSDVQAAVKERERNFKTRVRSDGKDGLFGGLVLPEFEHDFTLKYIGDRENLPRGDLKNDQERNTSFFRSVHLKSAQEQEELDALMKLEKEIEKKKNEVVFKVGHLNVRDRPMQMERCADILHDEPKTEALKHLRSKVAHHQYPLGYTTTPLSLLSQEPYVSPADLQNSLIRKSNPEKFITAKINLEDDGDQKDKPIDFVNFIHPDTYKPKAWSFVAKKKHPPQDKNSEECKGPRWE